MTTEIQDFIKTNFGVEMTTKVICVYKSRLGPDRMRELVALKAD